MFPSRLIVTLLACLLALPSNGLFAQDSTSSSTTKKKATSTQESKTTAHKKSASAHSHHRKKVTAARAHRMKRSFVASSDLRPMARQLVESRTPAAYTGVENYAHTHAGTEAGALAWFAIGYAHYLDAQYPAAIAAFQKAQPQIGELKDYIAFFIGNSYVLSNNPEESLAYLRDFGTRFPDSLYEHDATIANAKALLAMNRASEAIRLLEAHRSPAKAETEYFLGKAYVQDGQGRHGAEILQRVYYEYATSSLADQAEADLRKIPEEPSLPPVTYAEHLKRADSLYAVRRYGAAANEYRYVVDLAPAGQRPAGLIQLANSYRHDGNTRAAREALDQIPDDGSEASAEKWYQQVEIARDANDDGSISSIVEHMRASTPKSPWLESALLTTGNMYLLRKDYDHAIDYYREIHERFPSGTKAAYAHWKCAWLTYRQNRKDEAKKYFEEQVEFYPATNEVPNAMYWRGRMAEDDRDYGVARAYYQKLSERYRNYYYGVLARRRLATLPTAPVVTVAALQHVSSAAALDPVSQITDPPEDDLHYGRAKLLENAGTTDLAVRELEAGSSTGPCWEMLEVAKIYTSGGEYYRALQALKRAISGYFAMDVNALPAPYWQGLFPRPYWDALRTYSEENGLDPYLVASLIRQESEFNPSAISHSNAYGLMQLLPRTGKGEAKKEGLHHYSTDSLLDPTTNIELGTHYFRQMIDQFGGQVEYALAAYNAGADRVQDWRVSGNYRDVEEFVESIPFTETREYVQAIVRNAEVYKKVYGTP
ncbi:MAG: transglycosylase SLT domain-containing protein [Candidatus Korobacteraceae bacterium]|jgi:peptidoglycan lytic transglycosylase